MSQHDPSADTGPIPAPDPDPVSASAPRSNRGGVRTVLTSRAAGWVVATLLAGALTGLAVNVATAPSTTVVRQVSVVAPAALGRNVIAPAGPGLLGPCGVVAPGLRAIYLPGQNGSKTITLAPAPRVIARSAKVQRVSPAKLPVGMRVPLCGAQCNIVSVSPGVNISIHGAGPGRQVIIRRVAQVPVHVKAAQVKPGTQVVAPGIVCSG